MDAALHVETVINMLKDVIQAAIQHGCGVPPPM
jgi:hypothetical protein